MILAVPEADGVKVTPQLEVPRTPGRKVQLVELKLPATTADTKLTAPAGVTFPPATVVSVTVAEQVEAWLTTTGEEQPTLVKVVRRFTRILAAVVLELPL